MATSKTLKRKRSLAGNAGYSAKEARGRFERAVDIAVATKPMRKPRKAKRTR